MKSVIVISAFGRGQWISGELARLGFHTKLIDISEKFGRWSPEEGEGPFGFTTSERITPSQQMRLGVDDLPEPTENGFTIWPASGPIELKSPLTAYRVQNIGFDENALKWIQSSGGLGDPKFKKNQLSDIPFKKRWIANLACDFSATRFYPQAISHEFLPPENLLQTYNLRHPTRPGYERSLKWAQDQGVEVISDAQVIDIALTSSSVEGFEVFAGRSQIQKADHFVWMFSSEETQFLSKEIFNKIYSGRKVEPVWSWLRFRLKFKECRERESLPLCFLMVGDIEFPWTGDNYIFVKKTLSRDIFDAWVRVPTTQRFLKSYLEELGQKILNKMNTRVERLQASVVDYPQEFNYTFEEIGPSRVPLYEDSTLKNIRTFKASNLHFNSPETWLHQDWVSQLESQTEIVNKIQKWWELKLAEEKKREGKK